MFTVGSTLCQPVLEFVLNYVCCFVLSVKVSMGLGNDGKSYVISANWDPNDPSFEVLNTETAKGSHLCSS